MTFETKLFEVRDAGTFIPVMAVRFVTNIRDEHYLLRRAGYGVGSPYVLLTNLVTGKTNYDPYDWGNRTLANAHKAIDEGWSDLTSGDVIDVEFILKESTTKKVSERESVFV